MSYTALYRKYRPALFSDVLGQEQIVRTLKNQIINGKVSHAYLFCGTRGTGKTSLAKIFAKAINCLEPCGGEPCGVCEMCLRIADERSLNVIEIDAASNNGVDNIRDIREEVRYTPAEGNFKVYIIDEVHMLSAGAYNALLKTLEEPPSHVIFILATTDPQKIPTTIHSRCQRYDFRRIPSALISERCAIYVGLEGLETEIAALDYIARISDGSMRDALSLLDRCVSFFEGDRITLQKVLEITGSIDSKSFLELTRRLNEMDSYGALIAVEEAVRNGRDINQIIIEALSHFRNLLIAKSTERPENILDLSKDAVSALKEQTRDMETPRLMAYITAFSELQASTRYSQNARVLLEIELIKLCNPEIIDKSYEELYGKLKRLEKEIADNPQKSSGKQTPKKGDSKSPSGNSGIEEAPVKKVALPGDFNEIKERFGGIKKKLAEERENVFFAAVVERTEIGFLDTQYVYIIFEDETNENIVKNDPQKLEALTRAAEAVTGKSYNIKTITRDRFNAEAKGVEIINEDKPGESFFENAKSVFGEVLTEE